MYEDSLSYLPRSHPTLCGSTWLGFSLASVILLFSVWNKFFLQNPLERTGLCDKPVCQIFCTLTRNSSREPLSWLALPILEISSAKPQSLLYFVFNRIRRGGNTSWMRRKLFMLSALSLLELNCLLGRHLRLRVETNIQFDSEAFHSWFSLRWVTVCHGCHLFAFFTSPLPPLPARAELESLEYLAESWEHLSRFPRLSHCFQRFLISLVSLQKRKKWDLTHYP